jgi:hypothetical protein
MRWDGADEIGQVDRPTREGAKMSSLDWVKVPDWREPPQSGLIFLEVGHDRSEAIDSAQVRDRNSGP